MILLDISNISPAWIAVATVGLLIIIIIIMAVYRSVKKEGASFTEPLTLSVYNAGSYFQVVSLYGNKIQLARIIQIGNHLPILPDIALQTLYWFYNGNIPTKLRHLNVVFKVLNTDGVIGFEEIT